MRLCCAAFRASHVRRERAVTGGAAGAGVDADGDAATVVVDIDIVLGLAQVPGFAIRLVHAQQRDGMSVPDGRARVSSVCRAAFRRSEAAARPCEFERSREGRDEPPEPSQGGRRRQ